MITKSDLLYPFTEKIRLVGGSDILDTDTDDVKRIKCTWIVAHAAANAFAQFEQCDKMQRASALGQLYSAALTMANAIEIAVKRPTTKLKKSVK